MERVKHYVKNTKLGKKALEKGLFSKTKLRFIITNFIFQRILRINSDSPWSVHFTSTVICPERIEVGYGSERNFMRSSNCYIQAINGIKIGERVWWGANVGIVSANHDPDSENMAGHIKRDPIEIGDGCWIGMNSVILPGVKLGKNVTVGAGSIVTKSFPSDSVIAGNPAKEIGKK